MMKKILKWENLLLFLVFVFPVIIYFVTSLLNKNLPPFNFYIYFGKCLSIVKQNMGYYGTVFGLFLAMKKYSEDKKKSEKERDERKKDREEKLLEKQQEREQELIRIQEESNLLREKEIENRKDNYRPIFVIYSNKIELLMRKDELFLENIKYYPCKSGKYDEEGEFIGVKKSGECIIEGTEEDPIPDNFYISADTILGEKILFGFLYAEHKLYKYLNDGGNPSLPNGFSEKDYSLEVINQNWGSYNSVSNNYVDKKQELLYTNIEKLFFYNSMQIRSRIFLNSNLLISRIMTSRNHQQLYRSIFFEFKSAEFCFYKFNYNSVIEVIIEVYNQVCDKLDSFIIVNNSITLHKIDIECIFKNFFKNFQDEQIKTLTTKIKEFFEHFDELEIERKFSLKYILDCINEVLNISVKMPYDSNEKYQIIYFCITILHLLFENIEEVKEKSDSLSEHFLQDKSNILGAISFEYILN